LKTFDVTFQNHGHPPATWTIEAETERLCDLSAVINKKFIAMGMDTSGLAIIRVYEHKTEDLPAFEQGYKMASEGCGVMHNPYVQSGIQEPQATQWHEGAQKYWKEHGTYS